MEKHLGNIITKDDASQIVLHAIGRNATERELLESEVEYIDDVLETDEPEEKINTHRLIIPLYQHKQYEFPTMRIVIYANGMIEYQNFSGCTYPLMNPIEIYKIILSYEKEFKNLWESI